MEKETGKFQPLKKFKDLLKRVSERKSEKESEKIAREAILLFANGQQEPQQTFLADSQSEFDLAKLKEGSIFRTQVRGTASDPNTLFNYFVIGKTDNAKNISIYFVLRGVENGNLHEKLSLGPKWKLEKYHPEKNRFPVKEGTISLTNIADEGSEWQGHEIEIMYTEKIDIMSSGLKSKVKEQKEVSQRLPELKLATQNVN